MADSSQNRSGVANFEYLTVRDEEQDGESETVTQESQRGSPAPQRDSRPGATESEFLRKRKEKDKIVQNLMAMKTQAESLALSLAKQCEEVCDAVDRYQTTYCPTCYQKAATKDNCMGYTWSGRPILHFAKTKTDIWSSEENEVLVEKGATVAVLEEFPQRDGKEAQIRFMTLNKKKAWEGIIGAVYFEDL